MEFRQSAKFAKELKRLKKKYKSLDQDLEKLKKVLVKYPTGWKGKNWAILKDNKKIKIIKTRLSCASLKRRSLRVVYAYNQPTQTVEFIEFIEMYSKCDKEREDMKRIDDYLKES